MSSTNSILETKNNSLITLRELLSDNYYYRIPDYQRGYSWDKEFQDLWDDIKRLFHSNTERKHYIGMITLDEIKERELINESLEKTSSFYIVDGQQRITSLIIILQVIFLYARDNSIKSVVEDKSLEFILKGKSEIERFGYSFKRDDMGDYFNKRIFKNNKNIPTSNQYLRNINNAANIVEKELNLFDYEEISTLLKIILDRLEFNIYFITKEFDVRVTFETMNNRGKQLTNLELLKNRLMFLSTFFSKDSKNYGTSLHSKIDLAWKNIYDNLSYEDSQLSDDDYLRAHWGVYKKLDKNKGDAYIKDILENEFSIDHGTFYDLCKEQKYHEAYILLKEYIESLDKYSQYWAFVNFPTSNKLKINSEDELEYIKRLARFPNIPFLKATTMVVLAANVNVQDKLKYYDIIEKFVFINKLIAQTKNDFSFLTTEARNLLETEKNNSEAIQTEKLNNLIKEIEKHELSIDKERVYKAIESFSSYINNISF